MYIFQFRFLKNIDARNKLTFPSEIFVWENRANLNIRIKWKSNVRFNCIALPPPTADATPQTWICWFKKRFVAAGSNFVLMWASSRQNRTSDNIFIVLSYREAAACVRRPRLSSCQYRKCSQWTHSSPSRFVAAAAAASYTLHIYSHNPSILFYIHDKCVHLLNSHVRY